MRLYRRIGGFLLLTGILLAAACAPTTPPATPPAPVSIRGTSGERPWPELRQANELLRAKQYDQVISITTDCLKRDARGEGAASAWYLRGRAIDERPKATPAAVTTDLQEARVSYIKALGLTPAPDLEANIRNDLANVAYQQSDYGVAEQQWLLAAQRFDEPANQAWAIYRAGVCRQRMGRFGEADALFADVQQRFPNTEQAKRAREHQGARAFYVQVAAVSTSAAADNVAAAVRKLGVLGAVRPPKPGQGVFTVVIGPHSKYAQAESTKRQIAAQYPDAVIVP